MQNSDDFNRVILYAINDNEGCSRYDQLACSFSASRFTHEGMVGEVIGDFLDVGNNTSSTMWVILSDVVMNAL